MRDPEKRMSSPTGPLAGKDEPCRRGLCNADGADAGVEREPYQHCPPVNASVPPQPNLPDPLPGQVFGKHGTTADQSPPLYDADTTRRPGHAVVDLPEPPPLPLCAGAARFNAAAAACCGLFVVAPAALLAVFSAKGGDALLFTAVALIAAALVVALVLGVPCVCPVLKATVKPSLKPPPAGPFCKTAEGGRRCSRVAVKKAYILVNPFGGGGIGKSLLNDKVLPTFKKHDIEVEVIETEYAGHATDLARDLPLDGFQALCIIGGDGSIHEVANGMLRRSDTDRVPLGLIPGGTGNSVALDLGAPDAAEAAERVCGGDIVYIDTLKVTDGGTLSLHSVQGVFWGLVGDCAVAADRPWLRSLLGTKRYDAVALWLIFKRTRYHAAITVDEETLDAGQYTAALVTNTQHFGKGLRSAPDAKLDDGIIDCCFLPSENVSCGEVFRIFKELPSGSQFEANPSIIHRTARSLRIVTDNNSTKTVCSIDGQTAYFSTFLDIAMEHKSLQVFCPCAPTPLPR